MVTTPIEKALWFIEVHLVDELSMADIADASSVSHYNLLRAFGIATGQSVMRYVRGHRLTEAARHLATGAPDILTVALGAGYGSHEAFTRAFRDQFGLTPEAVRAQGKLDAISLVEPFRMDGSLIVELEAPRLENGRTLLIAGLGQRYSFETNHGIPQQWQLFRPHIGNIAGRSATLPMGCAAMPTVPATSNMSPASRWRTSTISPASSAACASRPALCGVYAPRPCRSAAGNRPCHLEQVAAVLGPRTRRRS